MPSSICVYICLVSLDLFGFSLVSLCHGHVHCYIICWLGALMSIDGGDKHMGWAGSRQAAHECLCPITHQESILCVHGIKATWKCNPEVTHTRTSYCKSPAGCVKYVCAALVLCHLSILLSCMPCVIYVYISCISWSLVCWLVGCCVATLVTSWSVPVGTIQK
jgi:hypothetical protein